ncbi:tetratricopeptide repeat protein [Rhodoblastus acidophilus]|uniref:Tetratricopeptide repeat protein n=1 Tax=Rhodoblastus acidophilus TaxID=1074 RepID=A0A6N8DRQ5_RHOAC|nr:cytochrome c3 family protein [Rhodoblastus acidophilus]MCW2276508.1 putative CXXCH cytochrome family protein [Rhodoblastus acidophilus]MTV33302.1 tetratricopeptide repeat protein [Rhodoblastus acidophilus]
MRNLHYGLLGLVFGVGIFLAVLAPGRGQSVAPSELAGAIGALSAHAPAGYAGSQACATCHSAEHKAWTASQHAQAMSVATAETVRGDFSGQKVEKAGSSGRFFKQDGQFMVETEGRDGKPETFRVSHTFGLEPLQQYLVSFPDGRLQALPWAWDTRPKAEGGQRWFHVYGDQAIPAGDPLHWTGRQQTWNYMCAECHSTALKKNYDAKSNTYHTTFSEISIGCESCHGPGVGHVTWAGQSPRANDPNKGFADLIPRRPPANWTPTAATGSPAGGVTRPVGDTVELCARCHARRGTLSEEWKPGKDLAQTHASAYLTHDLFYADGQMQDEVFNDQAFKQSRMYAKGVACLDCHDPHSGKLKAERGEICSQCHEPKNFSDAKHTGHKASPGAPDCIACHMPARTYMVVDTRHDHSFRIPRPDLTLEAGTRNACNDCHKDKSAKWADDAVTKWHGPQRKGFQTYAKTFQLARAGDPQARDLLIALAQNSGVPAIARGTALVELSAFPSAASAAVTRDRLGDPDPVVRIAAVRNLAEQPPAQRVQELAPLLDDPVLGVRLEVGRALAGVALDQAPPEQRARLERLFAECESLLRLYQDRPEGRANLAIFLVGRNRLAEAEAELLAGLKLDPTASELSVNLADLYRATGRDELAAQVLRDSLAVAPNNGAAHHALGLALVRRKNYPEALDHLGKASTLAPDDARFAYVFGVALKSLGKPEQSRAVLQAALQHHPWDAALLNATLSDALASGDVAAAAPLAKRLSSLRPDDQNLARLAAKLADR